MTSATAGDDTAMQGLAFHPDENLDLFADMLRRSLADRMLGDWRATTWPLLSELDAFKAVMSEARGGYGGARTVAAVCRELAAHGAVSPYAMSSAAVARALERYALDAPLTATILEAVESGKQIVSIALHEQDALPVVLEPQALLRATSDGYALDASKRMVAFGGEARWIIIPARLENGELAVVALDNAPAVEAYALIDGTMAVDLSLVNHAVAAQAVLASGAAAVELLGFMADAWAGAQCAEACGAMATMISMTREYLGVRKQFGDTLASNQVLRHRFIEMEILLAKADTMAAALAAAIDGDDTAERQRMVAAARYVVMRAAWTVSQEAMQMHGAIGMAAETPLGQYFKRLLGLSLWFGDEDSALQALQS